MLAGCATTAVKPPVDLAEQCQYGTLYHEVRGGETLWRISKMYNVDMDTIVRMNSISDYHNLRTGQRILIPKAGKKAETPRYAPSKDNFIWPARGALLSRFGDKFDRSKNKGIDIGLREGSDVSASRAGKVVFCDDKFKGFGKTVILDHGDRYQTVYAYNNSILVKVGDRVAQSTVIARSGKTGRAKEPSLHFEVRKDGDPQNPLYFLPR